jgi:hypothetical protein
MLKAATSSPKIKLAKSLDDALPSGTIQVDSKHDGVAFYSEKAIKDKYPTIAEKLQDTKTVGDALALLPPLINAHLHLTWQNIFSKGIAVLKPLPEHTTAIIGPAIDLARNLSQCMDSPLPASCPPNKPRCKPCVTNKLPILTPPIFRNDSEIFTIATVPHPLTLQSLVKQRDNLDLKSIRRETSRDIWIFAATKELLGNGISSFSRLPSMKDVVASDFGSSRSLWLTAEQPFLPDSEKDREELDWIFGFQMPRDPIADGKSETPVPGLERRPPPPKPEFGEGPVLSDAELEREKSLFEKAKMALQFGEKNGQNNAVKNKEIIEAWNLADTEIWKFIRAFNARRRVERRKWEDEEASFLGKGVFDRWMDKVS